MALQRVRDGEIVKMIDDGMPLNQIAQHLGVSRQRISQISKRNGIDPISLKRGRDAAKKLAYEYEREAAHVARWGCPREEKKRLDAMGLRVKFTEQRNQARLRGIAWDLTYFQWATIWENSGFLKLRGRGRGGYCMSRFGDIGPYSVGNVEIKSIVENSREMGVKKRAKKQVPGVFMIFPGMKKPWTVKSKGRPAVQCSTEEEAQLLALRLRSEKTC